MSTVPKTSEGLMLEIVNKGKCVFCGGCIGGCPNRVLGFEGEIPKIVGICQKCETCWHTCPRTFYDYKQMDKEVFKRVRNDDELIGVYTGVYAARSKTKDVLNVAQDGGVATTLLMYAMDKGIIDSSIVSEVQGGVWKAWPSVVSVSKELIKSAGTKYTQSPVHIGLQDAVDNQRKSKVGIVAVPCEVQAARKMQYTQKAAYRLGIKTRLIIGLFCMESFGYNDLINFLTSKGVEPKSVTKFSIKKGRFIAQVEDKEALNIPLEEIKVYARSACNYCTDFTAEHADISVGSVGSPEGWSTVIVRSKKGEQVFKGACDEGYIEYMPIEGVKPGLKAVIKLSETKKERAKGYLSA